MFREGGRWQIRGEGTGNKAIKPQGNLKYIYWNLNITKQLSVILRKQTVFMKLIVVGN